MLIKSLYLFANLWVASVPPVETVAESVDHLIGKHLEELGLELDLGTFANKTARKSAPLNKKMAKENLLEAEAFLASHVAQSIVDGKLQYEILRAGTGEEVQPYNSPIVRIKGRYLDGKPFSENQDLELLTLEEAIPAFRLGLVGMKENELRTLYVHPDFGYGAEGHLAPNALLIFEVEVIRADAEKEEGLSHHKNVSFVR